MNVHSSRRLSRTAASGKPKITPLGGIAKIGTKKKVLFKGLAKEGPVLRPKVGNPSGNRFKPEATVAQPRLSAADGLRAVRHVVKNIEGQHNKRLNEELARVYTHAMLLGADEDEWIVFCREAEWEDFPGKPKANDRSDALRFAVRFAVGFPAEKAEKLAATKRVSKLSSALRVLLNDQTDPEHVAAKLDELGVEQLSKEAARRNKAPAAPTVWTLQFPDDKSANFLASMEVGKMTKVFIKLEATNGMQGDAIVRKIVVKPQKRLG